MRFAAQEATNGLGLAAGVLELMLEAEDEITWLTYCTFVTRGWSPKKCCAPTGRGESMLAMRMAAVNVLKPFMTLEGDKKGTIVTQTNDWSKAIFSGKGRCILNAARRPRA